MHHSHGPKIKIKNNNNELEIPHAKPCIVAQGLKYLNKRQQQLSLKCHVKNTCIIAQGLKYKITINKTLTNDP